jgi:hypothetical protein
LILKLTANVKDETVKAAQITMYQEMKPEQLELIAKGLTEPTANNNGVRTVASYLGAASAAYQPAPTRNAEADKKTIEQMTPPRINWKEESLAANRKN